MTEGRFGSLEKLVDHPKINISSKELQRIQEDFMHYRGDYPEINYINSMGESKKREFYSLNMTKEVANYLSSITFNEQCEIVIDDNVANEFIQGVFNKTKFRKNLASYLEPMFATGGLVVKPYVNRSSNMIDFSWCLANTIYPIKSKSSGIDELAIASVTSVSKGDKTYYYTLLELHEWIYDGAYQITNELYKSDEQGKVGKRVPLKELYENLQEKTVVNHLTKPLFSYLKPAGFNNKDIYSPLGLGVCDNARPTIKQINETCDAFHWEIKQGKRRYIVSDHFLNSRLDEFGNVHQYFDEETDVFVALGGGIDDMTHSDMTSPIRSADYIQSMHQFISLLEMQTGLSCGTFTFDGEQVKTATEIVSKNSLSYRTRNKHIAEIEEFIKDLIISVFELATATGLYAGKIPSEDNIGVDFDDGVFVDKDSQLEFLSKATLNGFMPKVVAIQKLFGLPEEEAIEWLKRIGVEDLESDVDYQVIKEETEILG